MTTGRLRIIAGELRGRRLRVPVGNTVRPTPDRVREALFNILGERVGGARVLDAFAGSGALGLEAASRGAAEITLIEADPAVHAILLDNTRALLPPDRAHVVLGRAEAIVGGPGCRGPFDVVLADPPYGDPVLGRLLRRLIERSVLAEGARIVVETDRAAPWAASELEPLSSYQSRAYGRVRLDFLEIVPP